MLSEEIRERFLLFFKKRGHAILPSASLVPKNDPSVLFITAGMQPLVPYLLGEKHHAGNRLANAQKCVRMQDIEEVGDKVHDTFFEMLGNWSLGDYFKKEAIGWSYEFLTSKKEGLGLESNRLYITCFEGDENAPKDVESAQVWESNGISKDRIFFFGKESNWWSPGENGPCGPDTEIFYDLSPELGSIKTKEEFKKADDAQRVIELWNDVFMEYEKKNGKVAGKLKQKNVDTGAGLERLAMVMQKKDNIFDTDLFEKLVAKINACNYDIALKTKRIIADHVRTAVFIAGDGVVPSNTDSGYILRRLLRRAIFEASKWPHIPHLDSFVDIVIRKYEGVYKNLSEQREIIHSVFLEEEKKFRKTLERGKKELNRLTRHDVIAGKDAFTLFSTYGLPLELISEYAQSIDTERFHEELNKHRKISKAGAEKKFKGGLAGHSPREIQYHTATHLLHQALRIVLGNHVRQKGSNITSERLRFDFSYEAKMTDKEKRRVETLVNQKIKENLTVSFEEMPIDEARSRGAIGLFDDQYGERVRVYQIGDKKRGIFSLEFCGGPHVSHTGELHGVFKIKKEEAISAGVRRIKAVLE